MPGSAATGAWVYGAGFGWQIGFGVATYIMTAGVFLTIGLAILGASPASAVAIGAMFGLARGCAVFIGRSATTPAALAAVHAARCARPHRPRAAALVVQLVAAVTLAGAAWDLGAAALVAVAFRGRRGGHHPVAAARRPRLTTPGDGARSPR